MQAEGAAGEEEERRSASLGDAREENKAVPKAVEGSQLLAPALVHLQKGKSGGPGTGAQKDAVQPGARQARPQ